MSEIEGLLQRWDYKNPALTRAALEYAALGLRVIPLHGKIPFLKRWPDRATRDATQIVKWFETWHNKNLGIATGNGLIVVDVDPRNGGKRSFQKLTKNRKFPVTATALTGSGGHHYLFRVDPDLRIANVNGLLPGIDIKGNGGQIAVEPSVHPKTKKEYVWLWKPKQGIADAPSWLVKLLLERGPQRPVIPRSTKPLMLTRKGDGNRLLDDVIIRFPVKSYGQRHRQMNGLIGRLLGKGYHPDTTESVALAWTEHFYLMGVIRTSPADALREIKACIKSTLSSTKFGRAVGEDHRANIGRMILTSDQKAIITHGIVTEFGQLEATHHCNRVTYGQKLCRRRYECPFVESLTIYFTYKVANLQECPLKATNDQFRWVIEDRYGFKLDNRQFERLVGRYITRPDKPAARYELAVQTFKGKNGVPSQYQLTGLRQLLPPEAPESSLKRPTG